MSNLNFFKNQFRMRLIHSTDELDALQQHIWGMIPNKAEFYVGDFKRETLFKRFELRFYDAQKNIIAYFYNEECDRVVPKNAVKSISMIFYYDAALDKNQSLENWKNGTLSWAREVFGDEALISVMYHEHDFASPHIHIVTVPIHKNRLSSKHYCLKDYPSDSMREELQKLFASAYEKK